jgi:hypothetical protein
MNTPARRSLGSRLAFAVDESGFGVSHDPAFGETFLESGMSRIDGLDCREQFDENIFRHASLKLGQFGFRKDIAATGVNHRIV